MKKIYLFMFALITFAMFTTLTVFASDDYTLDTANASKGYITLTYKKELTTTIGIRIQKLDTDGKTGTSYYDYYITNNNAANFPLQLGAGKYNIFVMQKLPNGKFAVIGKQEVNVDKLNDKDIYTQSIQIINFNGKMISMVELNKLLASAKTESEKVSIIYNYIIENISYDFTNMATKASNSAYVPINDTTYSTKAGICYDYASLFASILRLNGIQTKLCKGYNADIKEYHAWNQVYIDGKWVNIDTTYDSQAYGFNATGDYEKIDYTMIKDASKFKLEKYY